MRWKRSKTMPNFEPCCVVLPNVCSRSRPAQNALPAPVMTTTFSVSSIAAASRDASISPTKSGCNALRFSGRLSVRSRILSCRSESNILPRNERLVIALFHQLLRHRLRQCLKPFEGSNHHLKVFNLSVRIEANQINAFQRHLANIRAEFQHD